MRRMFSLAMMLALPLTFGIARAADIFIDDTVEGFLTLSGSGSSVCGGGITTDCISTPVGDSESVSFNFFSTVSTATGFGGVFHGFLTEADTEGGTVNIGDPSDQFIFTLTEGSNIIGVTFISDPNSFVTPSSDCGTAYTSCDLGSTAETGDFQQVFQYVIVAGPGIGAEIDNFYVASDVTPEPGTIFLLGSGLAGVIFGVRKRRKA